MREEDARGPAESAMRSVRAAFGKEERSAVAPHLSLSGRVEPDGRGVGAFLGGHFRPWKRLRRKPLCIVSGPARSWDFNDASIIERPLIGVEGRIFPDLDQFGCADAVAPRRIFDIHGIANVWKFALFIGLA